MNRREFHRLLLFGAVLGILIGLLATGFRIVWLLLKHELWHDLEALHWRVVVSTAAGALIGVILYSTFYPGALSALVHRFHEEGTVPLEENVPVLPVGLIGLIAGQNAGPEGVMSVVGGSFGTWVAETFDIANARKLLTLAGMGAGFGTILGAPIGGALLWLELPHERGLEYYEAIVPTFVASFAGYLTEATLASVLAPLLGLGHGPMALFPSWSVTAVGTLTGRHLVIALVLGLIVIPFGYLYVKIFGHVGAALNYFSPEIYVRTTLAGLGIGLLGWLVPLSYFYGGSKMTTLLGGDYGVTTLLLTLLAVMVAAGLTIKGNWLGGLIIPHMFMGALVGKAVSLVVPGVPPILAMLVSMAGFNAVVTGTPLSSALIAISLTDGAAIVPVFLSALVAFVASPFIRFMETAAPRRESPAFHLGED